MRVGGMAVRVDPAQPPVEAAYASDWLRLARVRLRSGQHTVAAAAARMAVDLDGGLKRDAEAVVQEAEEFQYRRLQMLPSAELVLEISPESAAAGRELTGGLVWRAGEILARALVQHPLDFAGQRVLELGSGTGVAGLGAAMCGSDVLLTDLPEALPLLERNLARNLHVLRAQGGMAAVQPLDWRVHKPGHEGRGDSCAPTEFRPRDLVLAADILWREDQCEPAVRWLTNYGASCLFALSPRSNHRTICAMLERLWREAEFEVQHADLGAARCDAWLLFPQGCARWAGLERIASWSRPGECTEEGKSALEALGSPPGDA